MLNVEWCWGKRTFTFTTFTFKKKKNAHLCIRTIEMVRVMKFLWTLLFCYCIFSNDIADAFLGKFYDRVVRDLNALS
jgi:CDP-diglyceride synthetase